MRATGAAMGQDRHPPPLLLSRHAVAPSRRLSQEKLAKMKLPRDEIRNIVIFQSFSSIGEN